MKFDFFSSVTCISIASILVPLIACIRKIKALNNVLLRALIFYFISDFTLEVIGFILALRHTPNYVTQNTLTLIEGSIIPFLYFNLFKEKTSRRIIAAAYLSFAILAFVFFFFRSGIGKQDTVIKSFECIFIIMLSLAYFYKLIKELDVSLAEQSFSWINVAFFLYFCMALYFFLFDSVIARSSLDTYRKLYSILLVSNVIYYTNLTIGIWKIRNV